MLSDMADSQLSARIATVYELQSAWLEPRLRQIGVRWTTFQLLATVMGAGSEASQAEVARRLGVAPATLSESVHSHVQKGWLEQIPSDHDRRVKILKLTAQGEKVMARVAVFMRELEGHMLAGLGGTETARCALVLDQIIENLEKLGD